jgi:multicomponent Na+:H+ antiporter subunit D
MLNFIPFLVIIPLAAAFLISLFGRAVRFFSEIFILISGVSLVASVIFLYNFLQQADSKILVYKVGGWMPPFGICMVVDGLSIFMLVIINFIALLAAIYSIRYIDKYTDAQKFFSLFSLMLCGMNGAVIAGDIFNLFVFLEIASISSYALVAFGIGKEELEASFKYAIMGTVASILIFLGIAFLYGFTSTLNMADIARVLIAKPSFSLTLFVGVLFLAGFSFKSALIPFHAWLPDAHSCAPASISAMLSGVLIKALGVYSIMRIFFNVLGASAGYLKVFMFLGALSLLLGAILAFSQWDLKRMLAYSSISQIGYIVLGLGLGTPLSVVGALFHMLNHAALKPLLFFNAGAIEYATGKRNLKDLGGISKLMPVVSSTNLIASMSVCGIPPFGGFFSKLLIILACIQKGYFGYGFCAAITSIITLAAFMKMRKYVFSGEPKDSLRGTRDVGLLMKIPMVCLAGLCVLGVIMLTANFRGFLEDAAGSVLQGSSSYSEKVLGAALK